MNLLCINIAVPSAGGRLLIFGLLVAYVVKFGSLKALFAVMCVSCDKMIFFFLERS